MGSSPIGDNDYYYQDAVERASEAFDEVSMAAECLINKCLINNK